MMLEDARQQDSAVLTGALANPHVDKDGLAAVQQESRENRLRDLMDTPPADPREQAVYDGLLTYLGG